MKKAKAKRPDTRRERALRRDVANAQTECARLRQASANLEGLRQRAVSSAATIEANLQAELSRLRGEVASRSHSEANLEERAEQGMDPDLIVTLSRPRPDGGTEYVAHSADPEVVAATVAALERALRGHACRGVLRLAREAEKPGVVMVAKVAPGLKSLNEMRKLPETGEKNAVETRALD